jgi:hypothetical protein
LDGSGVLPDVLVSTLHRYARDDDAHFDEGNCILHAVILSDRDRLAQAILRVHMDLCAEFVLDVMVLREFPEAPREGV